MRWSRYAGEASTSGAGAPSTAAAAATKYPKPLPEEGIAKHVSPEQIALSAPSNMFTGALKGHELWNVQQKIAECDTLRITCLTVVYQAAAHRAQRAIQRVHRGAPRHVGYQMLCK